jgi:hypothetical protein
MRNGFKFGRSTYRCEDCGHMTRHTGVQSLDSDLCPDCYEIAGIYNLYQDYGADSDELKQYLRDVPGYCASIEDKGGKLCADARFLLGLASRGVA